MASLSSSSIINASKKLSSSGALGNALKTSGQTWSDNAHPTGDVPYTPSAWVQTPPISYTPGNIFGRLPPTTGWTTPSAPRAPSLPSRTPSVPTSMAWPTTPRPSSTPSYPSVPVSYPSAPKPSSSPPKASGSPAPSGAGSPPSAPAGQQQQDYSQLANMMALMVPSVQSQAVYVGGGGQQQGQPLPNQAERSFNGRDPSISNGGAGNYIDQLRAGFWGG